MEGWWRVGGQTGVLFVFCKQEGIGMSRKIKPQARFGTELQIGKKAAPCQHHHQPPPKTLLSPYPVYTSLPKAASMATSRLRKTLKYPSEDDGSSSSELDEEQQEKLITQLDATDARRNALYRKLFLIIPCLTSIFFLVAFVTAGTARQRLFSILSITSAACTSYILYFQPVDKKPPAKAQYGNAGGVYRTERPVVQEGPIDQYLILLNAALATVLQLAALLSWRKGNADDALRESLPLMTFGLMLFVRDQLAPVDLDELHTARYELKGA